MFVLSHRSNKRSARLFFPCFLEKHYRLCYDGERIVSEKVASFGIFLERRVLLGKEKMEAQDHGRPALACKRRVLHRYAYVFSAVRTAGGR